VRFAAITLCVASQRVFVVVVVVVVVYFVMTQSGNFWIYSRSVINVASKFVFPNVLGHFLRQVTCCITQTWYYGFPLISLLRLLTVILYPVTALRKRICVVSIPPNLF
jgi:hypothetical protein